MTTGWEDGIADLTEKLIKALSEGKSVLWLVSGGSNIKASVQIIDSISMDLRTNLSVMLADERYGPLGHTDSNWEQLLQAGFSTDNVRIQPILESGLSFEDTIQKYNSLAEHELNNHDLVIAQLGIGSDGHIAGILPNSPAITNDQYATGYEALDYKRLTLTFRSLKLISQAYVFAFGYTKKDTLLKLRDTDAKLNDQPCQILKQLKKACLYNDQIGDHE